MGLPKLSVKKLPLLSRYGKKGLTVVLLFSVIVGLFFPLFIAHAQLVPFPFMSPMGFAWFQNLWGGMKAVGGAVAGLAGAFAGALALMIVSLVFSLTHILLTFSYELLRQAIDPSWMTGSYTSGGVVDTGWPVVRDLANMFLVLVLVFIGLATALRLQEYHARKTLPLLIGIALLINFTPVILGVIVDAANIVTNFFVTGLSGASGLSQRFAALGSTLANTLSSLPSFDPLQNIKLAAKLFIMAIYNIFAAVVILLFAVLFIIRRVAIWMLVILSPIAFVSYILPNTRRMIFNQWWHQFLQWTFIGVTAAFFLWLGDWMIWMAAQGPGGGSLLDELLPYGVALAFLLIGFFVAMSTSAMGASAVISGFQRGARTATAWTGREVRGRVARWGRERVLGSPKTQAAARRLATADAPFQEKPTWGEGQKGPMAWSRRRAAQVIGMPVVKQLAKATATPFWAGAREVGRAAGTRLVEAELNEINRVAAEVKRKWKTPEAKYEGYQAAGAFASRIGIFQAAREAGQLKHLERFMRSDAKKRGLSDKRINPDEPSPAEKEVEKKWTKLGREALAIHPEAEKQIRVTVPGLAVKIREGFSQEVQDRARISDEEARTEGYTDVTRKIMGEMTADEAKLMSPSAYRNKEVKTAMHEFWGGPQIASAAKTFGKYFIDSFNEEMERRGTDWYERKASDGKPNNPKVLYYVRRTAAQELGFRGGEEGLSENEKERLRQGRETVPVPDRPSPPPSRGDKPEGGPTRYTKRPPRGRPGPGVEETRYAKRPPRGRPGPGVEERAEEIKKEVEKPEERAVQEKIERIRQRGGEDEEEERRLEEEEEEKRLEEEERRLEEEREEKES